MIKEILTNLGFHFHLFSLPQIPPRLLRTLGFGRDIIFPVTPKNNFFIKKETLQAFEYFSKRGYPNPEFQVFLDLAEKKRVFLDIGALYGIYCLSFSCINPDSLAFGFDPSPVAFDTLKYHGKINRFSNLKLFNLGMGRRNGTLPMKYAWIHLEITDQKLSGDHVARIITLDDFVKDEKITPDIIKIDTEGSEYNILKGGADFLSNRAPVIFLEVHSSWLKNIGVSDEMIHGLIKDLGFGVYDFDKIKENDPVQVYKGLDLYNIILSKEKL